MAGGAIAPRVRVDLHLHSSASFDCRVSPLEVARRCRQVGLSPIFLTDHDGIGGAQSLVESGPTVEAIKGQGGLVYLEHPYDTTRRNLREGAIERIAAQIDIVEVFNGRSRREVNRLAEELRSTLGVPAGAGSDAHTVKEIGSVYVEMEAFDGADDFLAKLGGDTVITRSKGWRLATERLRLFRAR